MVCVKSSVQTCVIIGHSAVADYSGHTWIASLAVSPVNSIS